MTGNTYPLASFCIASYNEEKYIEAALEGAIRQTYPNLEIIVSDDCSTDNTFLIIQRLFNNYQGQHNIIINRNEHNLGIAGNINKMLYELSHGEYILLAGGDDISKENRTSVSIDFMTRHPNVMSLSCDSRYIDERGNEIKLKSLQQISKNEYSIITLADYVIYPLIIFSGDSRVLRREVINSFPPLQYSKAEDIYMFIRSLYLGQIAFLRQPLVDYRRHSESISAVTNNRRTITKKDIENYKNTAERQMFEDFSFAVKNGYIPENFSKQIYNKIQFIANELRPRKTNILHVFLRRLLGFISRFCMRLKDNL